MRIYRPQRSSSPPGRARAALAWGLVAFATSQALLAFLLHRYPQSLDREYGLRRERLLARLAAHPGRPLALVMGNSRTAMGISPRALPRYHLATGETPLVYNFSILGAGPLTELLYLRRLLAEGVHPRWLLVEIWPVMLTTSQGLWDEQKTVPTRSLEVVDVPLLLQHLQDPWPVVTDVCAACLVPCVGERDRLVNRFGPRWFAQERPERLPPTGDLGWGTLDELGWLPMPWVRGAGREYRQRQEHVRGIFTPAFYDGFQIGATADRALRDLVALCKRNNISLVFFTMPEGAVFRSWYPPRVRRAVTEYLAGLSREYGVPVVDTRDWVPEGENFYEGFHLVKPAAEAFTRRFGRVVLQPLLEGKALAGRR